MPKRYLGNIITDTATAPTGQFQDSSAVGVWSVLEALTYKGASLWPTQGVQAQVAFFMGGQDASNTKTDTVEKVIIDTTGSTTDFADLSEAKSSGVAGGNTTKAIYMGGSGDSSYETTIDTITYATGGSAASYGNLTSGSSSGNHGQIGNNVRSLLITYRSGVGVANHVIEYVNPASDGNGVEWGTLDYSTNLGSMGTCSSSVRGLVAGGYDNTAYVNTIYRLDIASGGVSNDFGDLTNQPYGLAGMASATRGVFAGGNLIDSTYPATIQYVTIASTGNATDFGDLNIASRYAATVSGSTKGLYAGGQTNASTRFQNIDVLTFSTTGNATDFGDLTTIATRSSGASAFMGAVQIPATSSAMAFVNGARQTGDDGYSSSISFYNIATTGNGQQFGEMRTKRSEVQTIGGATRIIMAGGRDHDTAIINEIDYIETSNQGGTASDFGDMVTNTKYGATFGNSTRGLIAGGDSGSYHNVIQYLTIATTGNTLDFGDMDAAMQYGAGFSSPTRGVISGGQGSSTRNEIKYVTIASTGNATDFGDLTQQRYYAGGCSSSTRGLTGGGNDGAPNYVNTNIIDYVTIASTGNATDFGDLTGMTGIKIRGASSETRGTFLKTGNTICYVTIASTGNATDFGDLPHTTGEAHGANSNAHGGLQ